MRRILRSPRLLAVFVSLFACLAGARAQAQLTNADGARLRIGLEAGLGPRPGGVGGASFGAAAQLGVQIGRHFAVFYQPSLRLDAFPRDTTSSPFRMTGHLLMADVTVGPFQLGLGAGVDATRVECQAGSSCGGGAFDLAPALGGRFAALVSLPGVRARWGIPIAAHLHLTDPFSGERVTALTFTIGIQRY